MNARIFSSGCPASGYRLISAVTRMLHLPAVTQGDAEVTRIAEPRVQLAGKIRWLVAEVEAPHEVLFVEQVADPQLRRPAAPVTADGQIREVVWLRHLVVPVVEKEPAHAGEIEPAPPTRRRAICGPERIRVARRVRLLAAFDQREQRELLDLRLEPPNSGFHRNAVARPPVEARLDAVVLTALGVRRHEEERRGVAENQL